MAGARRRGGAIPPQFMPDTVLHPAASALPAGQVATTIHRGPYAGLAAAHRAVLDWCAAQGRRAAGPRWEVYGPHRDDPAELTTEIYWLLS